MSQGALPSSFDGDTEFYEENRWQKFSRRLKEEPLIPLGCALTCWAFYGASRSIRAGDSNTANVMFRRRLYAQSFTLVAMVAGSWYYKTDRTRRKEFEGLVAERKAKEKNEAWIRELEARDKEEKEWRAKRDIVAGGKKAVAEDMILAKAAAETDQGTEKKSVEGPVVKAVKELNSTLKEGADVIDEKVGARADTNDKKEK